MVCDASQPAPRPAIRRHSSNANVDLYIDPSLRGKGHGRDMIKAAADEAKELGCFRLAWSTKHDNPARKLYDELAACDFVEYRRKLD
jgi:GNAT superfamily N-acetyltransferase